MALNVQPVYEWLKTYGKETTRRIFSVGLKQFLAYIYQVKVEEVNHNLEQLAYRYVNECKTNQRDWFKDLLAFAASFQGKPPKTAHTYLSAAKNWLEFSLDVELSRKQLRLLRGRLPKGKRASTIEVDLTPDVLRRIVSHAPIHGKALFSLLASSGIRIGEALQLKLPDIDLKSDPPKITVRAEYTKAGDAYYTFMSTEAREIIEEWLKQRKSYLESAVNRGLGLSKFGDGRGLKSVEDERVFPFCSVVATQIWHNCVAKAGLDEKDSFTNRRKLHIHMLRKFFQSQLKYAGVPEDIVEALIGHSGYLDEAYRRYTFEQIASWYKRGEPYLLINVPKDISEIQTKFQKDIDELRSQVIDLTRKLTDANALSLQLMREKETIQNQLDEMKLRIRRFEEFTQRFLKATSEELEDIAEEVFKRKRKPLEEILEEEFKHQETVAEDSKVADKVQRSVKGMKS